MRISFWITLLCAGAVGEASNPVRYTDSGELVRPADYREWVYLTSGIGMTYGPAAGAARDVPPLFDNVFVSREAYHSFLESGRWPEKTIFILEVRYSQSHGSINKGGSFQTDIAAIEIAVKDTEHSPDAWSYYDFPTRGGVSSASAKPLPRTAGCYACHNTNGAVENTFVQFYPTLLEVARAKGTVKASFKPWAPSPARMYHIAASEGWPKAEETLVRTRVEEPDAAIGRETVLNRLAYQLLGAGKKSEAVAALKYACSIYPKSANLADSLSEAYEQNGQRREAAEAARRTLALLDSDTVLPGDARERLGKSSRERLARLGSAP